MSEEKKMFRRGSKPKDVKIDTVIVDTIKNSMLNYPIKSEYYLYLAKHEMLNAILALCFLKEKIMSKKIKALLQNSKLQEGWIEEMKDVYFRKEFDQLNVAQIVQKASQSFNHHEKLILGVSKFFKDQLPPNKFFDHEFYQNKLRIQEIKQKKLIPFNNLSTKDNKQGKSNDLILMKQPAGQGIFLLCFSSLQIKPQRSSINEEQIMRNSKKQEKTQKKREKKDSQGNQPKNQSNKKQREQTHEMKEQQMTYNFEQEENAQEKKDDTIFSIILFVILVGLLYQFFRQKI